MSRIPAPIMTKTITTSSVITIMTLNLLHHCLLEFILVKKTSRLVTLVTVKILKVGSSPDRVPGAAARALVKSSRPSLETGDTPMSPTSRYWGRFSPGEGLIVIAGDTTPKCCILTSKDQDVLTHSSIPSLLHTAAFPSNLFC